MAARRDLYGDAFNEEVFMRPGQAVTKGLVEIDDEAVDGAGTGLAALVSRSSGSLRLMETGYARSYALSMLAGAVLVIGAILAVQLVVTSIPWLTVLWAVPMVGAAVVILLPASQRALAKWLSLAISIAVLAVTVLLAVRFEPGGEQYQFVESHKWIPSFGTGYILGLDGIALAIVALTAVLVPLLLIAGWNDASDQAAWGGRSTHAYFALTLAVEGMVIMSLASLDVLLFYVFFEAMLIPMYFLIGGFGGEGRSKAAVKFLLYNLFGGLIMLAAVIGLYVVTARQRRLRGRHLRLPRDRRGGVQRRVRRQPGA